MKNKLILVLILFHNTFFAVNIEDLYTYLKTVNNGIYAKFDNITYESPSENYIDLSKNWLLQTPGIWGHSINELNESKKYNTTGKYDTNVGLSTCSTNNDCGKLSFCGVANFTLNNDLLCLTHQYDILNTLAVNIESANYSVDISQLGNNGITFGEFTYALKNALYKLALKSITMDHVIDVRLIEGSYIPDTVTNLSKVNIKLDLLKSYFKDLVSVLPANNKLKISIANMNSCSPLYCHKSHLVLDFSWNHGKIINIDNNDLVVGGEDFYGAWYMGDNPVADVMIEVQGPIVNSSTKYLNILWEYVENHKGWLENKCYTYENGKITSSCLTKLDLISLNKTNIKNQDLLPIKAMSVSKIDGSVLDDNADQSELARVFLFKNATSTINISQQALYQLSNGLFGPPIGPTNTVDGNLIDAIAFAIYYHHVNVNIITSQLIGNANSSFSSSVSLDYIRNDLLTTLMSLANINSDQASSILNKYLHLATLDYSHSGTKQDLNHIKFWEVDNHLLYFGSHNMYSSGLQEFGIIIDSESLANLVNQNFWIPMFNNSY